MSLSIEPKKGIRLQLSGYQPIRSWQAGGKFWEHDFQLTIRQGRLAEFLPCATEEGGGSVFYEHVADGREVVSESQPVSGSNPVPPAQLAELQAALSELKVKVDDPLCDPTKKRIIEAFRLPDPVKDAELYRLSDHGRSRRLLVLWGVEKEAGSALAPLQAIGRMPAAAGGGGGIKNWWWLLLLLLLALLVGGWFYWRSQPQRDGRERTPRDPSTATPATPAPGVPPGTSTELAPGDTPGGSSTTAAAGPGSQTPIPPMEPSPASKTNPSPGGSPGLSASGAMSTPGDSSKSAFPGDGSSPAPGANRTVPALGGALPPGLGAPGAASVKPAAGQPAPTATPTGSPPPSPPAIPSKSAPAPAKSNGSTPPPSPAASALPSAAALPTLPSGPTSAPKSTRPPGGTPPPSPAPAPGATPKLPDEPVGAQPGAVVPEPGPSAPVPPKVTSLEIIKASTASSPENGKVEVVLSALHRDAKGISPTPPRITQWRIDDTIQEGEDNRSFTGATLPVTLGEGVHHVVVTSTTADGRALKAEADVDVKIKRTEESNVQVRPAPR